MIVQELLARLGFTVDQTGADTFNNRLRNLALGAMTIGATIGAKLMAGFVKSTIQKFGEFQDQLNQTRAVTGATTQDMKLLENQALKLANATKFTASEIAAAQGELAKAGFDKVNDVLLATPGILNLAAAGNMAVAQSAELSAGAINGFGLKAKDAQMVADIFAKTANLSAVGLSDIAETAKYAAPSFRIAGQSIDDFATLTAIMGNNMIKGSMAGTALSTGLTRLATQPKAALKALDKWKIVTHDQKGNMINIIDLLIQMKHKLKDATQQEKVAALTKIFGMEASRGFLAVLNASETEIRKMQKQMKDYNVASQKMADIMNSGVLPAFNKLKSAVEVFLIKVGQQLAPTVTKVVDKIRLMVNWLNSLSPSTYKTIGIFATLMSTLTTLFAVFTGFKLIIPMLASVWTMIMGINLSAMAIPIAIGLVIAFLVMAIQSLYVFYKGGDSMIGRWLKDFPTLRESLRNLIKNIINTFEELTKALSKVFNYFFNSFGNIGNLLTEYLIPIFYSLIYVILLIGTGWAMVIIGLIAYIMLFINALMTFFNWIYDSIFRMPEQWKVVYDTIYSLIISFVESTKTLFFALIQTILFLLKNIPIVLGVILLAALGTIINFIGQVGKAFYNLVFDIISWFGNAFLNVIPNFIKNIPSMIGNLASQIGNLITGQINVPVSVGAGSGSGKGITVGAVTNQTTVNVGGSNASPMLIANATSKASGSSLNKSMASVAKNYGRTVR